MNRLKRKIICQKIVIIGCYLIIMVYIAGLIGMFISPRIYFSDLFYPTIITILIGVILFLANQNLNADLKLLAKRTGNIMKKELEKEV